MLNINLNLFKSLLSHHLYTQLDARKQIDDNPLKHQLITDSYNV